MATQWVTYVEACKIVGCTQPTISRAISNGHIVSRHAGRKVPALDRATVEEFARAFAERQAYREQKRRASADHTDPPDTVHLWLTPNEAGDVLGITGTRVWQLVNRDRLPHTRRGRRIWIRLDHAEQAAAARAFWAMHSLVP